MPIQTPESKQIMRVLGIALLGAGAYLFFTQNGGVKKNCSSFDGDRADCLANGCYYWDDGTCKSTRDPYYLPCSEYSPGQKCYADGFEICDKQHNLCGCAWNDETHQYEFQHLEPQSPKCLSGINHKECFTQNDYNQSRICIQQPGEGANDCYGSIQEPYGCSCQNDLNCRPLQWSSSVCVDNRCSKPGSITALMPNMPIYNNKERTWWYEDYYPGQDPVSINSVTTNLVIERCFGCWFPASTEYRWRLWVHIQDGDWVPIFNFHNTCSDARVEITKSKVFDGGIVDGVRVRLQDTSWCADDRLQIQYCVVFLDWVG